MGAPATEFRVYRRPAPKPDASQAAPVFAKYGDLLTPSDIAAETGQCVETIRSLIKSGELPGRKIGQRYYVPKVKMLEFLGVK